MKKLIAFAIFSVLPLSLFAQGPAYPYNVGLSFTASTGTVTGYNMYRFIYNGTACVTFAKLNATPFTGTTYTDPNPPQGDYCYAATAVNGSKESGFSNIFSVISIPPAPPTGLGAVVSKAPNGSEEGTFTWAASTGQVDTYTVGIGNKQGGPYTVKHLTVNAPATKAVTGMSSGTKWAIAWASKGADQSGPSNEVKVVIP